MEISLKKRFQNFWNRDWIQKGEGKLTYFQIFGFVLIILGIVYFSSFLLPSGIIKTFPSLKLEDTPIPEGVSIAFFTTILGVSFAFPDMLRGQTKEMSTMRIIVFMFANVICMLLLKIGWDKTSLLEIELDGFWVAVIGFLFGAKAAQSYLENKLVPPTSSQRVTISTNPELTNFDIVGLAIGQYQSFFNSKGNVRAILHGKKMVNGVLVDCLTIHLKDNNREGIPVKLLVKVGKDEERYVETDIIEEVEKPSVIYSAGDSIANSSFDEFKGSLSCELELPELGKCLLTCCHVMSAGKGSSSIYVGNINSTDKSIVDDKPDGNWFYALRDDEFDIALIKAISNEDFIVNNSIKIKNDRELNETDVKTTRVRMIGRKDFYGQNNIIEGFVMNHKAVNSITIGYDDGDFQLRNLILIARITSFPYGCISQPGDSGSLVIDDNQNAIGMVVAQNSKFTYAISFTKIIRKLHAKIV